MKNYLTMFFYLVPEDKEPVALSTCSGLLQDFKDYPIDAWYHRNIVVSQDFHWSHRGYPNLLIAYQTAVATPRFARSKDHRSLASHDILSPKNLPQWALHESHSKQPPPQRCFISDLIFPLPSHRVALLFLRIPLSVAVSKLLHVLLSLTGLHYSMFQNSQSYRVYPYRWSLSPHKGAKSQGLRTILLLYQSRWKVQTYNRPLSLDLPLPCYLCVGAGTYPWRLAVE